MDKTFFNLIAQFTYNCSILPQWFFINWRWQYFEQICSNLSLFHRKTHVVIIVLCDPRGGAMRQHKFHYLEQRLVVAEVSHCLGKKSHVTNIMQSSILRNNLNLFRFKAIFLRYTFLSFLVWHIIIIAIDKPFLFRFLSLFLTTLSTAETNIFIELRVLLCLMQNSLFE